MSVRRLPEGRDPLRQNGQAVARVDQKGVLARAGREGSCVGGVGAASMLTLQNLPLHAPHRLKRPLAVQQVDGPVVYQRTCMSAPNTPCATGMPRSAMATPCAGPSSSAASAVRHWKSWACGRARATSPSWRKLGNQQDRAARVRTTGRFILPFSSSNTRNPASFAMAHVSSVSPRSTPTSARSPGRSRRRRCRRPSPLRA